MIVAACEPLVIHCLLPVMRPPATRARYQLVVKDLPAARAELAERGVQTSEISVMVEGVDGSSFSYLADPDGNEWAIQEVRQYVGAAL